MHKTNLVEKKTLYCRNVRLLRQTAVDLAVTLTVDL